MWAWQAVIEVGGQLLALLLIVGLVFFTGAFLDDKARRRRKRNRARVRRNRAMRRSWR